MKGKAFMMRCALLLAATVALAAPALAQTSPPDLDARLAALKAEIAAQTYSRTDLDQKLKAAQAAADGTYAGIALTQQVERQALDGRVAKLETQDAASWWSGSAPWWGAASILGAVLSFAATWYYTGRSERRADAQRAEDIAQQRRTAANALALQWISMGQQVSAALGALVVPTSLGRPDVLAPVVNYGNWLDLMVAQMQSGDVDAATLRAHELDDIARDFLAQFDKADAALGSASTLKTFRAKWTHLILL